MDENQSFAVNHKVVPGSFKERGAPVVEVEGGGGDQGGRHHHLGRHLHPQPQHPRGGGGGLGGGLGQGEA